MRYCALLYALGGEGVCLGMNEMKAGSSSEGVNASSRGVWALRDAKNKDNIDRRVGLTSHALSFV